MPCNYKNYDFNWKNIRKAILNRAKHKCELCNTENYKPHWKTGSRVVLTVHHIDFDKENNKPYNLLALCQRCHLKLDMPMKIKNRTANKLKKMIKNTLTLKDCLPDQVTKEDNCA